MQRSNIKNQNRGSAASRDDLLNFAFYILHFDFLRRTHRNEYLRADKKILGAAVGPFEILLAKKGDIMNVNHPTRRSVLQMLAGAPAVLGVAASFAGMGSIIIVVATDAPLLAHQLKRLARRAALGLARNGSIASNGSGDIFIAFSTANEEAGVSAAGTAISMLANDDMNPLFAGTVEATEEAIINALVAGRDMTGQQGRVVKAINHEQLQGVLRQYGRLPD